MTNERRGLSTDNLEAALDGVASRLEEMGADLARAIAADVGTTMASTLGRDVPGAVRLLRGYAHLERHVPRSCLPRHDRPPLERVGLLLPYNSICMATAMVLGAAIWSRCGTLYVHLPSRMGRSIEAFGAWLDLLPGVRVVPPQPGVSFFQRLLEREEIDVAATFGDDIWMSRYYEPLRRSNVKMICDGPGKDPFIVFADADIEAAVDAALRAGLANSGQSCSSPERFYVHRSLVEEFTERVRQKAVALRVGGPYDPQADIGPLGSTRVVTRLRKQLEDAVAQGARIVCGGEFLETPDFELPALAPTVIAGCTNEMLVFRQESFAPIIPVMSFSEDSEALAAADASEYGLTATLFGGTAEHASFLARSHGRVFHDSCIADPQHGECRLYWGGYRKSGWIWSWEGKAFITREGPRCLAAEFQQSIQPKDL